MKCEQDIKRNLFQNIVLAGGCTMFDGIQKRMEKEVQALAPSPMAPAVFSPADRKHSSWLGGAILSISTSSNRCGSQRENSKRRVETLFIRSASEWQFHILNFLK